MAVGPPLIAERNGSCAADSPGPVRPCRACLHHGMVFGVEAARKRMPRVRDAVLSDIVGCACLRLPPGCIILEGFKPAAVTWVSGAVSQTSYTLSRQYDAENHLIGQTNCGWPVAPNNLSYATLGYAWGPIGHPAMIGSSGQGSACPAPAINSWETLHWDGDTLLFTTTQSGKVDDVKIGMMADYTPTDTNYTGLTMWDRDMGGIIASTHNSSGYGVWDGESPHRWNWRGLAVVQPGGSSGYKPPAAFTSGSNFGQGGLLFERATDGYSDIYNVIQGVRAYDPLLGGWTSPDALSDIKPYMYNGNNPIENSDASGLDYNPSPSPEGQPLLTDWETTDAISMGQQEAERLGWVASVFGTYWVPGYQTGTSTPGNAVRDAIVQAVWHPGHWQQASSYIPGIGALPYWGKCLAVIVAAEKWNRVTNETLEIKRIGPLPYDVGLRHEPGDVPGLPVPTPVDVMRQIVETAVSKGVALSSMPSAMNIVQGLEANCAPLGWKP